LYVLQDIKALGKESLIYGFSTVFARFLNFLLVPFYTHYLLTGEYGIVAVVFSYIAFFNIVYQYGMDQAYMRFVTEPDIDKKDVFSTCWWTLFATSLFISLILWFGCSKLAVFSGIGAENAILVRYSAIVLALDALVIVPFAKLRMEHRAWQYVFVRSAGIFVNVVSNIVLIAHFNMGIEGVFISAILASGISFLLLLPLILKSIGFSFNKTLFVPLLSFAWPFVPAGLGAMIVRIVDRPILLFLTDKSTVGIYQTGYRLGIFMVLMVSMFDQAWRPFFLERAKNENAKRMFSKVLTYFVVMCVFVVLGISFLIGDIIKTPYFGTYIIHPDYWKGLGIVPIILSAYLFYGFYVNFMAGIVISKKTKTLVWATLLGATVSISTNFLLIPVFSMTGAAVATLISYMAMASYLYFASRRAYPIPYEFNRVLRIFIVGFIMWAIYSMFERFVPIGGFALSILWKMTLLSIYPLLLWMLGFWNKKELDFVKGFLLRKS
jgi:O-antigen/teichoic acid export membrane protein